MSTQQFGIAPSFKLLSKTEVCAYLGISGGTLEGLVRARQLPEGVRRGKPKFWTERVICEYQNRRFSVQEAWKPAPARR